MDRWKRGMLALVAVLMAIFFVLSSTDLLIREKQQEIKRISVIVPGEEASVWEDFRRGIQEAANEERVEVNYLALEEEEGTMTQTEVIDRECQRGAQAIILSLKDRESMEQHLEGKEDMVPLVTVNSYGSFSCLAGSVLYDTDGAAKLLAEKVVEEQGSDIQVIFTRGESQISQMALTSLKDAFADRDVTIETSEGNNGKGILVGCSPRETEELLSEEWADKGWAIYGMGYSETLLKAVKDGSLQGVIAYSMYAMGVHALQEAVRAIEQGGSSDAVYVGYKWITKENLEEEQSYLFPIH